MVQFLDCNFTAKYFVNLFCPILVTSAITPDKCKRGQFFTQFYFLLLKGFNPGQLLRLKAPHGPDGFGATTNRQKNWQSSSRLKYFINLGDFPNRFNSPSHCNSGKMR